ncbi:MAG: hypothetical protein IKA18_03150 [Clostridia bacterium]|nr:hypothetical protein [Clostridia bacterium]MBR2324164.1 hypothetical protein [Clostridia bacterium]
MSNTKRILAIIICCLLVFSITACEKKCEHKWGYILNKENSHTGICDLCGYECEHDWNTQKGMCRICRKFCDHSPNTNERTACEYCGSTFEVMRTTDVVGKETEFAIVPVQWAEPCQEQGTIEKLYYTTDAYNDGNEYEKYVLVYLPYGYDQNDTSKKYNVVYFQHANGSSREIILQGRSLNVIDNMFYRSDIEPVIIVCTTFYLYEDNFDVAYDGQAGTEFLFHKEVLEDIVPLVESKYNTYTTSFDDEGLKESREHRAFTGFSRGGACTWNMINYAIEYFQWFSPMSCTCTGPNRDSRFNDEDAYQYIANAITSHPDLDVFIFAASGGDKDIPAVKEQIKHFLTHEGVLSYGKDPSKNNFYYLLSDLTHGNFACDYYYNSLQVFFK